MKKLMIFMLIVMFVAFSAVFGISCKQEEQAVEEEQVVEEEKAVEEEQAAEGDQAVESAKERTLSRTQKQTIWDGPTSGPKAAEGKKIVYIAADMKNAIEAVWGETLKEAAELIGWEVTLLDGKGTVQGQIDVLNQAISMNVDGISTSANVEPLQESLEAATEAGIIIVGIHATNTPGPDPELNLFSNITSSGTEIGKALADYIIADSNGEGRAIILYDAQYAIAREKAESMKNQLATCSTCELLDYVNSPLSDVTTQMPQLASTWVSTYEAPFYVMTIADYYYDFVVPTLRSGNVDPNDVILLGSDGTEAAYNRIRNGEYQVVTIPEPNTLFGYMAVDEFNRAFNDEPPSGYIPSVYCVTPSNVDEEGGDQNQFIPSNNFAEEYAKIWGIK